MQSNICTTQAQFWSCINLVWLCITIVDLHSFFSRSLTIVNTFGIVFFNVRLFNFRALLDCIYANLLSKIISDKIKSWNFDQKSFINLCKEYWHNNKLSLWQIRMIIRNFRMVTRRSGHIHVSIVLSIIEINELRIFLYECFFKCSIIVIQIILEKNPQ